MLGQFAHQNGVIGNAAIVAESFAALKSPIGRAMSSELLRLACLSERKAL
jgi:hypothetical protein